MIPDKTETETVFHLCLSYHFTFNVLPFSWAITFLKINRRTSCSSSSFQSLIKDSSTLEVCGWISKEDALAFGTEYPKGTLRRRRDGSTFELQAALLEVEQRFLNPFRGHLAFNLESSQLSGPLFAPAQL